MSYLVRVPFWQDAPTFTCPDFTPQIRLRPIAPLPTNRHAERAATPIAPAPHIGHKPTMPQPPYILAIDQGTTSTRCILFDAAATPVATAQRELTQHYPA